MDGKLLRRALAILTLGLLALPGPTFSAEPDRGKGLELIKPRRAQVAKDFQAPTPDNGTLRLRDFRGKVVFLNFWATWCPPCKEELPGMERAHQKYKAQGLVVLAISLDADGPSAVKAFLKEHGLTFPVGLDPKMAVANLYGVRALPSSVIIDRKGQIAGIAIGERRWDGESAQAFFESLLR